MKVKRKILFTKEIPSEWLKTHLTNSLEFSVIPILSIEIYPVDRFKNEINFSSNNYLISSQNAVKAIAKLDLKGKFYVVGERTANELTSLDFKVEYIANSAYDLANYISENENPQEWFFFCGKNHRVELPEILAKNGHKVSKVECYNSLPNNLKIDTKDFNGFVFFSPLGVDAFFLELSLPDNAQVFAIGNTTANQLKFHSVQSIIIPDNPDLNELINKINKFYDA